MIHIDCSLIYTLITISSQVGTSVVYPITKATHQNGNCISLGLVLPKAQIHDVVQDWGQSMSSE